MGDPPPVREFTFVTTIILVLLPPGLTSIHIMLEQVLQCHYLQSPMVWMVLYYEPYQL